MSQASSLLNHLAVASPCTASWDEMTGDEQVRFCHHCKQNVYNLSTMNGAQAEVFVAQAFANQDSICVRFYRRKDGTILTKDCPVGLRALRRRALAAGALVGGIFTFFIWANVPGGQNISFRRLRQVEPFATILAWFDPEPTMTMGCPNPRITLHQVQPKRLQSFDDGR